MKDALQSFPLAIVICVALFLLLFRRPIGDAIGRVRKVGFGDKIIDTSGDAPQKAAEQQKRIEGSGLDDARENVTVNHNLPPENVLYEPIESGLKEELANAHMNKEVERAWLIRAFAVARIERAHEVVYRIILGSQISFVLQANTPTLPDIAKAREIYDAAKAAYPDIYSNFEFQPWITYPISAGLLKREHSADGRELFRITPAGQDFLHYLVRNGLTSGKVG